jgi:hypothetical protein
MSNPAPIKRKGVIIMRKTHVFIMFCSLTASIFCQNSQNDKIDHFMWEKCSLIKLGYYPSTMNASHYSVSLIEYGLALFKTNYGAGTTLLELENISNDVTNRLWLFPIDLYYVIKMNPTKWKIKRVKSFSLGGTGRVTTGTYRLSYEDEYFATTFISTVFRYGFIANKFDQATGFDFFKKYKVQCGISIDKTIKFSGHPQWVNSFFADIHTVGVEAGGVLSNALEYPFNKTSLNWYMGIKFGGMSNIHLRPIMK